MSNERVPGELVDPAVDAYQAWQNGDVTAIEALRTLCPELESAVAIKASLEGREQELRGYVEAVLRQLAPPEPLAVGGLVVELTRPSVTKGYDRKALDALARELTPEWAVRLDGCRTETTRAGGLRVTREKQR